MPYNARHNYGSVVPGESLVFINSGQLAGVQTVNLRYENNAQELKYLGMSKCRNIPVGARIGSFDVSYFIITDEMVLPHTGNSGVNGYMLRARDNRVENFSFSSGYLTSYSSRASIGEIPQAQATFTVFGDVGKLATNADMDHILANEATPVLKPTAPSHISISLDDFSTNRVVGYEINLSVPRNPTYRLGYTHPIAVKYVPPILVDVQFTMEKNDYVADKLTNYPYLNKIANLNIVLRDFELNQPVVSYSFSNMMLKSESYSQNVDGRGVFQLGYRNYYI